MIQQIVGDDLDAEAHPEGKKLSQPVRLITVVGVEDGDPVASGSGEPDVASDTWTAIDGGTKQVDAIIPAGEVLNDHPGLVGRAIVDHQDLPGRVGPCLHGGDRLPDEPGRVVGRDNDGDARRSQDQDDARGLPSPGAVWQQRQAVGSGSATCMDRRSLLRRRLSCRLSAGSTRLHWRSTRRQPFADGGAEPSTGPALAIKAGPD